MFYFLLVIALLPLRATDILDEVCQEVSEYRQMLEVLDEEDQSFLRNINVRLQYLHVSRAPERQMQLLRKRLVVSVLVDMFTWARYKKEGQFITWDNKLMTYYQALLMTSQSP